jgi:transcriptional regulator with XRE-family HTH domain
MTQAEASMIDIGQRLRILREERGISMRALARRSGLSANALSMIERNLTSPSVTTLCKLSHALEVPITALFHSIPNKQPVVFCSIDERTRLSFFNGIADLLGGEGFNGRLSPFILTLEKDAHSGQYPLLHSGDEFILCLEGELEYKVDGVIYPLRPGDALIFDAGLGHHWRNRGSGHAQALIVISNFNEGENPAEYHRASADYS